MTKADCKDGRRKQLKKQILKGLWIPAVLSLFGSAAFAGNIVTDGGFENGNTAGTRWCASDV